MMVWNSFSDFLAMGGYGLYVWGSVGATALLMLAEPIIVARRNSALKTQLQRQFRAERADRGERSARRSQA